MIKDNSIQAFFALLRAGLFPDYGEGGMVHDSIFKDLDWEKVYQLAQEQSVQGIVLQGIERFRIQATKGAVTAVDWRGASDRAAE